MNGLDNPWVLRAIPVPKPAKTHTHTVGTDFCQAGYGLLVSFCKYVSATGNPWLPSKNQFDVINNNLRAVVGWTEM